MTQLYNFLPIMNTMKMYKKKKNYRLHDAMNNLNKNKKQNRNYRNTHIPLRLIRLKNII